MQKAKRLMTALALPVLLSGCASGTASIAIAKLCEESWKEVQIRKADQISEPTAKKILGNNDARKAIGCTKKG